jgi:hypothetical protein
MGTWSTALFGGDIACDVRENYVAYLKMGMTARKATKQIMEDYADEISDTEQDGPAVLLALAITQWKYGRLEPRIKAQALKVIKNGADVASFEPADQKRRRKVLEKVRAQLQSPQPAEKPVRIVKPAEPLKKIEKLWKEKQVVAFRRHSNRFVLLLTEGVILNEYIGQIPYFVLLNWEGAKLPTSERIRKMRPIRYVIGVRPNRKGTPIPWERIQRMQATHEISGFASIDRHGVFCDDGFEECHWNELDSYLDDEFDQLPEKNPARRRNFFD